jgi:U3 small nucleolar RNA-associated protein 16
MLSKLLRYAQNILTFQIAASLADTETETSPSNPRMVKTRRQSGSNSDPPTDVSPAMESLPQDVPSASSKKRQQPQVADESTSRATQDDSISRKRQKLPVREKDEPQFERHPHIAVEIPVRDITQDNTPMWTAPEQEKSKGKSSLTEDKSSNPQAQEKDTQDGEEPEEGHILSPVAQEAVKEDATLPDASEKTSRERGRKMKTSSKPHKTVKLIPDVRVMDTSKTVKPKHKRFDSEEPAAEEPIQVVEEEAKVEEEDESSDDDAPEVVATHDAQERAIVTARNATKAAEESVSPISTTRSLPC